MRMAITAEMATISSVFLLAASFDEASALTRPALSAAGADACSSSIPGDFSEDGSFAEGACDFPPILLNQARLRKAVNTPMLEANCPNP
jgi:hypothetical protein